MLHRIILLFLCLSLISGIANGQKKRKKTNFIVIFTDDLGYGDLGCYGSPTIRTPHLDRMATEGQKWTNFYVGESVCTPSRAALLTGRLPVRSGMCSNKTRVLFPNSVNGIPSTEITLAEQLKKAGYATAAIGKWHLGHREQYLPTSNGFDYYFGIPYSNDMDKTNAVNYWEFADSIPTQYYNVPLMRNTTVIERPANQHTITQRYTEETIRFIREHKRDRFFIYLSHNLPHIPLFASEDFRKKSARGLYGDVVEEIDDGIGRILATLKREGLDKNTIVVFTSDNGPWLLFNTHAGSAGPLYAGKGTTWEGGMRVPAIFWGPGKIKPSVVTGLGTTMDLFTTFSAMAGIELPEDRPLDGIDLSPVLLENKNSPREGVLYYRGTSLYAVRLGKYKAHFITQGEYGMFGERKEHITPLLYNLDEDPGEKFDVADKYPEEVGKIVKWSEAHKQTIVVAPDQLVARE